MSETPRRRRKLATVCQPDGHLGPIRDRLWLSTDARIISHGYCLRCGELIVTVDYQANFYDRSRADQKAS